jgi:acetate CoA/acetoacetate CoA-transferase beta subunit
MTIALRAAREFVDGSVVNLGFGIPSMCAQLVPDGIDVVFHTENGALGFGEALTEEQRDQWDLYLVNASGQFIRSRPGMTLFDHSTSFGMVRGGHIDVTVLGGLQVSQAGDLANWRAPGKSGGMGGAMDLAIGANRVIVTMEHTTRENKFKIVKKCDYPLTAVRCVDLIITDIAVIEVASNGLLLREHAPGWTPAEIQELTEPELIITSEISEMNL